MSLFADDRVVSPTRGIQKIQQASEYNEKEVSDIQNRLLVTNGWGSGRDRVLGVRQAQGRIMGNPASIL